MIQKITLSKIWIDKTPTQYGSFKTNFLCNEYGTEWVSGFAKEFNHKEGDVLELDIIESETINQKTGKPFRNWKFPNKDTAVNDKIARLEFSITHAHKRIDDLIKSLKKKFDDGLTSAGTKVPDFTPNTPAQAQDFENKMANYDPRPEPTEDELNEVLNNY